MSAPLDLFDPPVTTIRQGTTYALRGGEIVPYCYAIVGAAFRGDLADRGWYRAGWADCSLAAPEERVSYLATSPTADPPRSVVAYRAGWRDRMGA